MKKTNYVFFILIILSFLSVLGALYLFLYRKNKSKSKESFTNKPYPVVVSLTTSPRRIPHIKKLLDTLTNQTVPPDAIVLNLPYVFKRNNSTFDEIPPFITENPVIKVNRCEDIGPATKILPTVSLFSNPETILISVDDDIEYRNNFIETLLKYNAKAPNAVITGQTFMLLDNKNDDGLIYGEMVEGFSSVLYKKKHFDNFDMNELLNYPRECYFADDFILSNYLRKEGIDIIVTSEPDNNKLTVNTLLDYGTQDDALHKGAEGGNIDNYKKCSAYLKSIGQLYIKHYDT